VVQELVPDTPILGICLGHQVIASALGGRLIRSEPMHGQASPIEHDGQAVFAGLPNPLAGCRYHSLAVDEASLPADLRVTARTADGLVMGIAHRERPVAGLQFHPESILTPAGYALLAGFLRVAGLPAPDAAALFADELAARR
jgi:anthranilate synthase component 2